MTDINHKKNNGVYYTPSQLSRFIATHSIDNANTRILDPCYGEGSLLLAAQERLQNLGCRNPTSHIFGYDIVTPTLPITNRLSFLVDSGNLSHGDFFLQKSHGVEKFDLVLMNPPFVRHHLLPKTTREHLHKTIDNICDLHQKSDLWAYFIIYATSFLRSNGRMAAILPWTFLHANYAQRVRLFLSDNFSSISVLLIGQHLFKGAEERILVLLADGFGHSSSNIDISHSFEIPSLPIQWRSLDKNAWIYTPLNALTSNEAPFVLSKATRNYGFQPLGQFAKVRIGTVTGANGFFTLDQRNAKTLNLPKEILVPIIKRSNQLDRFVVSTSDRFHDVLLLIPEDYILPHTLKSYIKKGQDNHLNERNHTRKRTKWYCINKQRAPDAFLPYMSKEVPFLAMNPERWLSTNTIHGVYFADNVNTSMKRWIQLSMLTSVSQLSIEMSARTYGSSVLKIEPSDAAQILVYAGNGKMPPAHLYDDLDDLLSKGERLAATRLADDWFATNGLLSANTVELASKSYSTMRNLRLGSSEDNSQI